MTSSMIERVARRIANEMHAGGDFGMTGEYAYSQRSAEFLALGRAAIEAMRDPTDAMVDTAWDALGLDGDFIAGYQAAIDAALNEQVAG